MSKNKLDNMIVFEVGSLEWLEARSHNITATEASSLFGLNKYKSPARLLKDKLHPEKIWSPFIRRGRILEPAVIQAFKEDMSWDVRGFVADGAAFFKHPTVALSATPDALLYKSGNIDALVECKTASEARMVDWDTGVPLYYAIQVHVQMICTNIEKSFIGCLGAFDPFPFIVYEIAPNHRINEMILNTTERWWKNYRDGVTFSIDNFDKYEIMKLLEASITRVY